MVLPLLLGLGFENNSRCWSHGLPSKHVHCAITIKDMSRNVLRYKLRPKFHQYHCEVVCRLAKSRLNPKYAGCNLEEDFVGKVMRCATGAVHSTTLSLRVLQRWLLQYNCWLAGR